MADPTLPIGVGADRLSADAPDPAGFLAGLDRSRSISLWPFMGQPFGMIRRFVSRDVISSTRKVPSAPYVMGSAATCFFSLSFGLAASCPQGSHYVARPDGKAIIRPSLQTPALFTPSRRQSIMFVQTPSTLSVLPHAPRHDPERAIRQAAAAASAPRCHGAVIQASISSAVVRITGMAFGWIAPTSAFGSVVRKPKRSFVISPSRTLRTEVQRRPDPGEEGQRPALVEGEPDVAAGVAVELAEARERHDAAVLRPEPALPVRRRGVADVGRAAVRLHPQQRREVDRLALGGTIKADDCYDGTYLRSSPW